MHPAVDQLLNSGKFVYRGRSEIFTEHELKDRNGKVVRKVTKDDLEQTAKVNNAKADNGALSPLGPGHTYDDQYDAKGNLLRKFPEEDQPKPLGYLYRYSVALNPHTNKYSLYADEYVQKVVRDPKTGEMVDGIQYAASFPRRSAEIYHAEHWIDWVAMLRRAPRLDLALELYSKTTTPDHVMYERDTPVCQMARDKWRYSYETGGDAMPEPAADPTTPPAAAPAPEQQQLVDELPPEHKEAAEHYARHTLGMHHTRAKHLMHSYAKSCGMQGDMMTPHEEHAQNAMAVPGAAAVTPKPATPPHNPSPVPEHAKMQQDQLAIEKERYERRLVELEKRAADAEAKELKTYYERQLMQLVHEGFDIDAAKELEWVEKRKYGRDQFDDHIAVLRRAVPKAPVGDIPPLNDLSRDFRIPSGGAPKTNEMSEEEFAKVNRYMRHNGCTWDEAKERYKMNGAAK